MLRVLRAQRAYARVSSFQSEAEKRWACRIVSRRWRDCRYAGVWIGGKSARGLAHSKACGAEGKGRYAWLRVVTPGHACENIFLFLQGWFATTDANRRGPPTWEMSGRAARKREFLVFSFKSEAENEGSIGPSVV
jgi:hypothetical protein